MGTKQKYKLMHFSQKQTSYCFFSEHFQSVFVFKKASRPISTAWLNILAMLTPAAYQPPGLEGVFRIPKDQGKLILGSASRLDAFSGYPFRT